MEPTEGGEPSVDTELDALDEQERTLMANAVPSFSEATKAIGTVFLLIEADGRVERLYRVPTTRRATQASDPEDPEASPVTEPTSPTSDDLTDAQQSELRTHELLAVREAHSKRRNPCPSTFTPPSPTASWR